MKGLDRHRVIGSIFLIFALVTYSQTVKLSYQVAIFPKTAIAVIALMGFLAIIKSFRKKGTASGKSIFSKEIAVAGVALLVTYGLMAVLGFYTAAALFIFFMFLYTERDWQPRTFLKSGIFSLVTTGVLYFLFSILMNLVTPEGWLI